MQVLNSSVPRPWEITTKHVRAGFEAGLEGLKAMNLEQNNMTRFQPQLLLIKSVSLNDPTAQLV